MTLIEQIFWVDISRGWADKSNQKLLYKWDNKIYCIFTLGIPTYFNLLTAASGPLCNLEVYIKLQVILKINFTFWIRQHGSLCAPGDFICIWAERGLIIMHNSINETITFWNHNKILSKVFQYNQFIFQYLPSLPSERSWETEILSCSFSFEESCLSG